MRTIGRYQVRGPLGRGGSARVLLVRDPELHRLAALKLWEPRPELAAGLGRRELLRRFLAEARTLAGLRHPHLAQVWDFGRHHGRPFYVMEHLCRSLAGLIGEGRRLEEETRRLLPEDALAYCRQALAGLGLMHAAGLVHRDVKPDNLLLTHWDQVRLADLGLARRRGGPQAGPANLLVGSPGYAAPEQEADPAAAGPAADLYSLGVTLLRLVTGLLELPPGQDPSSLNPELGPAWDRVLARATARRPAERYPDAAAMEAALAGLAADWEAGRAQACAGLLPEPRPLPAAGGPVRRPRSRPLKARPGRAGEALGLDGLGRPRRLGGARLRPAGEGTVRDAATGLVWEAGGSARPVPWRQAHGRCRELDRRRLGGRTGWRLPTVDELASLLSPPAGRRELCLEPVFDPAQRWLWSADRATYTTAWLVHLDMAFVSCHDFNCLFYARAVCPA